MASKKKKMSFEESIEQLEVIIKDLEQGNVSLDDMVKKYSDGMILAKNCLEQLEVAEANIDMILKEDNNRIVQNKLIFSEE